MRTAIDKVKKMLCTFPIPPPPTPDVMMADKACGYAYGRGDNEMTRIITYKAPRSPSPPYVKRVSVMTEPCCDTLYPRKRGIAGPISGDPIEEIGPKSMTRKRKCGCVKTSCKVKKVLDTFPSPPPPTPDVMVADKACGYGYGRGLSELMKKCTQKASPSADSNRGVVLCESCCKYGKEGSGKSCSIVSRLVTLVQLSVTATALALYYLIFCYMQLVYYTLRSAMFFHNADGPMKVTIAVVTVTSLIIAFNIMLRMESLIGIVY